MTWTPDIEELDAQNKALAVNISTSFPSSQGIVAAFDIAERALASRRLAIEEEGNDTTDLLRAALDREKLNLDSARAIHSILTGSGTDGEKAFSLLREGLRSRPAVLGTTSPRLHGYVEHQKAAAGVVENLSANLTMDIFDIAANVTRLQAAQLNITITTPSVQTNATPCDAFIDYANSRSVPAEDRDDCSSLNALPTAVAQNLTKTINAFRAFENATITAYANVNFTVLAPYLNVTGWELNETLAWDSVNTSADWNVLAKANVNVGSILGARAQLLDASRDLRNALTLNPPALQSPCAPKVVPLNDTIDPCQSTRRTATTPTPTAIPDPRSSSLTSGATTRTTTTRAATASSRRAAATSPTRRWTEPR